MKKLTLTLSRKWFDLIKSGEKKEEYREIKPYWNKRLLDKSESFSIFTEYDEVEFTLGCPRKNETDKRITFAKPHIRISHGRPEWGAKPDTLYFVITWGEN